MCTHSRTKPSRALGGDRVVEVLGVVGIDREGGQLAQVARGPRPPRPRGPRPRPPPCAGTSGAGRGRASAPRSRRAPPRGVPIFRTTRGPALAGAHEHDVALGAAAAIEGHAACASRSNSGAATRKRPRLRSTPIIEELSCRPSRPASSARSAGPRRGRSRDRPPRAPWGARPSCRCSRRWAGSTRPR